VKILITVIIALMGLAWHVEVSPQLEQAQQRAQLCQHWNEVNEAKQDQSGVFYSSSGILDQTLIVHLSGPAGHIEEDQFLDEMEKSDAQSGEMRSLGFSQVQCGSRIVKLHERSEHPSVGSRELDIEPVG
jgi:hypothetical protein